MKKPECKLTETDGNVFALAGKVTLVLKRANQKEKAKEFSKKLADCESYDKALQLMAEYVEFV